MGRDARSADYLIPAYGSLIVDTTGGFVRCLSAATDFEVGIDGGSGFYLAAGMSYTTPNPDGFRRLELFNDGAAALSVKLAIGWGELQDDRAQFDQSIAIKGGGASFTDNAAVSVGTVAAQILAANNSRTRAIIRAGGGALWLGPNNTVTASGLATIAAGGELEILHAGAIWGIRSAGTVDAGAYEETE